MNIYLFSVSVSNYDLMGVVWQDFKVLCLALQGVVFYVYPNSPGTWWLCGWLVCTGLNPCRQLIVGFIFLPLSLINGCSDKQTSWVKGNSSERQARMVETEQGGGSAFIAIGLLWFFSHCQSAVSDV